MYMTVYISNILYPDETPSLLREGNELFGIRLRNEMKTIGRTLILQTHEIHQQTTLLGGGFNLQDQHFVPLRCKVSTFDVRIYCLCNFWNYLYRPYWAIVSRVNGCVIQINTVTPTRSLPSLPFLICRSFCILFIVRMLQNASSTKAFT